MDLGGAAVNIDRAAARLQHQPDTGGEQHPHHFQRIPNDSVQVDHIVLGGISLPPAEGKNLIDNFFGPAPRFIDLVDVLVIFIFRAQLLF